MHYSFKLHEENFKDWVKSGFVGIPEPGIAYLKNLTSPHLKTKIKLFNKLIHFKQKS